MEQIHFTGNLEEDNAAIFIGIEKSSESKLGF